MTFPLNDQIYYDSGTLQIDSVPVETIASEVGTPFYCYSHERLIENIRSCKAAFESRGIGIHYAVKANSNIHLLRIVESEGLGVDLVSGGELSRAEAAGFETTKMVFSGVGKRADELTQAIAMGVGQINVESAEELELLGRLVTQQKHSMRVALRINPHIEVDTHKNITTGSKGNKFGIEAEQAFALYQQYSAHPCINIVGLAMHIGSQLFDDVPYRSAIRKLLILTQRIQTSGGSIDNLDLGGGFGVSYESGEALDFECIATVIAEETADYQGNIFVEPGRSLVADIGLLISEVTYVKEADPRPFVILDAAMNDLMRPALYQAVHPTLTVKQSASRDSRRYDIVGPICESTDTFAYDYPLDSAIKSGDLLAFFYAGAYSAVMCNSYNSRDIIPEVLVQNGTFKVIRQRVDQEILMGFEI